MEVEKKYLSRAEAAKYIGISVTELANLARKSNGLKYSKLSPGRSGKVIYNISDIDAFIESLKVNINM